MMASLSLALLPSTVEARERWPLALAFGSARLGLHTLLLEHPEGSEALTFLFAKRLGVHPDQNAGPHIVHYNMSASPVLRYEHNINGGIPSDTIELGQLTFEVDPESRAKSSVVAGIQGAAGASAFLTTGTILSVSGLKGYRKSVTDPLAIRESEWQVALSYTSDTWYYMDASIGRSKVYRELADDFKKYRSVTFGKIVNRPHSVHEISASILRMDESTFEQNRIRFNVSSLNPDIGFWRLGFEFGETVEGALAPRLSIFSSYSNEIFGKPTTISFQATDKRGGDLFGVSRDENVFAIQVNRNISNNFIAYTSVENTMSSIDSFSETVVELGFSVNLQSPFSGG